MKAKSGIVLLISCVALAAPAQAQSPAEARLRDQLRQTTLDLRQAQDENSALKVKLDALSQQAAPPPAPVAAAPTAADTARLGRLQAALSAEQAKTAAALQQGDSDHKALAQWQQSYAQLLTLAKSRDADAKKFEAMYKEEDSHAKACTQSNVRLVQISDELLSRYKNKGVWDAMGDGEPLTGIHRVELEKIAQDYHARIVDSTVKPAQALPGAAQ
jgi:hypothetical protein